ncbi:hypothetical protein [Aliarcobacter butzleri]|uniref:hypothetical protein n=1 Tax=Aliarcobacter butzleri TaxID=28197 RepID=UPI001ED9C895|nr:hypothetical protein [Aliarcobacter butzleri]MCG3684520.1 hypothetical protein [Aliarcobacter butzleri]
MARLKKLNIFDESCFQDSTIKEDIFYDKVDTLLSKEHIGYYIIGKSSFEYLNPRIYLCLDKHKEYYFARQKRKDKFFYSIPKLSEKHLFTHFPEYKSLINEILDNMFILDVSKDTLEKIIKGAYHFFKSLKSIGIILNSIHDINDAIQVKVCKELDNNNAGITTKTNLRKFFSFLEKFVKNFKSISFSNMIYENIKALPSSVVYQLDYFARIELNEIMNKVNEYENWMEELKTIELFSIENLARTYYEKLDRLGNSANSSNNIYKKIAINLHNINLNSWSRKNGNIIKYHNQEQEKTHKKLVEISRKGINIELNNEKMFAFWYKTLFPNYPFSKEIDDKYKFIYPSKKYFRLVANKSVVGLKIKKFDERIFPTANQIYPLILILMIREGVNSEVLRSWSITKNKYSNYEIGDMTPISLNIKGRKERSNSIIEVVIEKDSEQKRYIDFFLKWLKPIYEYTGQCAFFQYIGGVNLTKQCIWNKKDFFSTIEVSPYSFYKKYKIFDTDNLRLNSIAHNRLRPYSNYADYLRGYTEFVRQYKKSHQSIDTQIHYEFNTEWSNQKRYKIAKTQDLLVNLFKGKVIRNDDVLDLFTPGLFADCSNPKEPTYYGSKILKSNERCINWKKCLTECDKAYVIPKIHGKVIYAWIIYMEKEKNTFIRVTDWEEEYLLDYYAAMSVFNDFSDEEKQYIKENYFEYEDIVKMRFKKKVKIKEA